MFVSQYLEYLRGRWNFELHVTIMTSRCNELMYKYWTSKIIMFNVSLMHKNTVVNTICYLWFIYKTFPLKKNDNIENIEREIFRTKRVGMSAPVLNSGDFSFITTTTILVLAMVCYTCTCIMVYVLWTCEYLENHIHGSHHNRWSTYCSKIGGGWVKFSQLTIIFHKNLRTHDWN